MTARQRRRLRAVDLLFDLWPVRGTCLRRSLVAGRRLRELGPLLRVGVRRAEGRLSAHAWVEIDGLTWDRSAPAYTTLDIGTFEAVL